MGKVQKYISALQTLGDGRYHYWDGRPNGIGCSEYTRLALLKAGIIAPGDSFHAGSGNPGVLADTTKFRKIKWSPSNLREGHIMWSNGYHVATWDGKEGVYEAAPEWSHGICDNGKTGVGHWSHHGYRNCGNGTYTWSCLYEIIDVDDVKQTARAVIAPETVKGTKMNKEKHLTTLISFLPVISKGSTGSIVKALQTIMKAYGWYAGEIDGMAGDMTVKGIKMLQTALGVYVDGVCGKDTWTHILK